MASPDFSDFTFKELRFLKNLLDVLQLPRVDAQPRLRKIELRLAQAIQDRRDDGEDEPFTED